MYCPQCATANTEGVRFCRSCGMELEAVALVLGRSAQPNEVSGAKSDSRTADECFEKRTAAVKNLSTGISLLVVSLLIGVAMALFVPANIPWMLAWAVLVGWMAMWGSIEVGNGIAGVLDAKSRLRRLASASKSSVDAAPPQQLTPVGQPPKVAGASSSIPPASVTEGTTRQLDDSVEK